jgi:hypothetical protein
MQFVRRFSVAAAQHVAGAGRFAPAIVASSKLSEAQKASYRKDGFLCIPNWCTSEQLSALRSAGDAIVAGFDAEKHKSVFSTYGQETTTDEYFLGSDDKIRCFFETVRPCGCHRSLLHDRCCFAAWILSFIVCVCACARVP